MALGSPRPSSKRSALLLISRLIRPHWKALFVAVLAVLGETLADILEPWPIKIVVDNLLQSKPLRGPLAGFVFQFFGHATFAILNFALAAVVLIAVVSKLEAPHDACENLSPAADLFTQKLDGVAWRSKPSSYIVATNDRTVQPELQRFLAKRMGATTHEVAALHARTLGA